MYAKVTWNPEEKEPVQMANSEKKRRENPLSLETRQWGGKRGMTCFEPERGWGEGRLN